MLLKVGNGPSKRPQCEESQVPENSLRRPTFQLVLRGQPLDYFLKTGAVLEKEVNSKGEFVTWLSIYDSEFMGYRGGEIVNGMSTYRNFWVSRGSNVSLRATVGNRLLGNREVANWQFYGCN